MCNVTSTGKLSIIAHQADNPYHGRLVQIIHSNVSRASYFCYFRCRLFANITQHTKINSG